MPTPYEGCGTESRPVRCRVEALFEKVLAEPQPVAEIEDPQPFAAIEDQQEINVPIAGTVPFEQRTDDVFERGRSRTQKRSSSSSTANQAVDRIRRRTAAQDRKHAAQVAAAQPFATIEDQPEMNDLTAGMVPFERRTEDVYERGRSRTPNRSSSSITAKQAVGWIRRCRAAEDRKRVAHAAAVEDLARVAQVRVFIRARKELPPRIRGSAGTDIVELAAASIERLALSLSPLSRW
jgi:hypothetical protein